MSQAVVNTKHSSSLRPGLTRLRSPVDTAKLLTFTASGPRSSSLPAKTHPRFVSFGLPFVLTLSMVATISPSHGARLSPAPPRSPDSEALVGPFSSSPQITAFTQSSLRHSAFTAFLFYASVGRRRRFTLSRLPSQLYVQGCTSVHLISGSFANALLAA